MQHPTKIVAFGLADVWNINHGKIRAKVADFAEKIGWKLAIVRPALPGAPFDPWEGISRGQERINLVERNAGTEALFAKMDPPLPPESVRYIPANTALFIHARGTKEYYTVSSEIGFTWEQFLDYIKGTLKTSPPGGMSFVNQARRASVNADVSRPPTREGAFQLGGSPQDALAGKVKEFCEEAGWSMAVEPNHQAFINNNRDVKKRMGLIFRNIANEAQFVEQTRPPVAIGRMWVTTPPAIAMAVYWDEASQDLRTLMIPSISVFTRTTFRSFIDGVNGFI